MSGFSFTVEPNGSLRISADSAARRRLTDADVLGGYPRGFALLTAAAQQAGYGHVRPEWIGALTDAPIFGEKVSVGADGKGTVGGRVWWFRQYEAVDELQELRTKGTVVFAPGP